MQILQVSSARMGTATPRKGGLLGVVDAALQVAPESIAAMESKL